MGFGFCNVCGSVTVYHSREGYVDGFSSSTRWLVILFLYGEEFCWRSRRGAILQSSTTASRTKVIPQLKMIEVLVICFSLFFYACFSAASSFGGGNGGVNGWARYAEAMVDCVSSCVTQRKL
jgi:hypothetical protein